MVRSLEMISSLLNKICTRHTLSWEEAPTWLEFAVREKKDYLKVSRGLIRDKLANARTRVALLILGPEI